MYCTDFEYDNKKLSDYDMMIGALNGSGGSEIVSSGADIVFNQICPSGSGFFNLYSSAYQEPFTTTFQVMKNPCKCRGKYYLSPMEVSHIQRWLCQKNYNRFKIFQEGYEDIHWNAVFSSRQVMLNGHIAGLELTLYTDAPYAYLDQMKYAFHCTKNVPGTLYDTSDELGSIYPDVLIIINEPGIFKLENSMDNKVTEIRNVISGEAITIHGRNQTISSSNPDHKIFSDFNWFFPRIINTYQNNRNAFTASLECDVTFTYSPIRKVGL